MKDIAVNRKAYHDYEIEEKYEAGLSLTGSEVKSIRAGKVSLKESYVSFTNGEAYVKGMHIAEYKDATYNNHDEYRTQKRDKQALQQMQDTGLYLCTFETLLQQQRSD